MYGQVLVGNFKIILVMIYKFTLAKIFCVNCARQAGILLKIFREKTGGF